MDDVKAAFDGYDVGIRYADGAVGAVVSELADLGVLDETAVLVGSDHGEQFGELGVYCDHQGADQATTHIPAVLRWPGLEPRVQPAATTSTWRDRRRAGRCGGPDRRVGRRVARPARTPAPPPGATTWC